MVFKKRVIAPLAFAWTLAAAGMAAVAFSTAPSAPAGIAVEDVQIGERGAQTRIAFICSAACALEKRGQGFFLKAVDASFDLDLSARKTRIESVSARPGDGGAVIVVTTAGAVDRTAVKSCTVGGRPAACLDLFFDETPETEKQADAQPQSPSPKPKNAAAAAPAATTALMRKPALREAAPQRLTVFAGLAPPQRLEPPNSAILAKVQPIEKSIEVGKPSIRAETPLAASVRSDFVARVNGILGKNLTSAYCNNAEATLKADAWALGAMVDVGLCVAARGDLADADAVLARLLEYTPDNYEALVGRALIAEEAHEKGVARKYYQDALNALPPIEESHRIVQAMAALQ